MDKANCTTGYSKSYGYQGLPIVIVRTSYPRKEERGGEKPVGVP